MMAEEQAIIDIHAHILPGVDDGARDMAETRRLLESAYAQGVRHVIATPHYAVWNGTGEDEKQSVPAVLAAVDAVQEEALQIAGDLNIYPGQEILYYYELAEHLDAGKVLTLAGTKYVLIEFTPGEKLRKMELAVRKLVLHGYAPVIAHVERYTALRKRDAAETLIGAGALLQMNFSSLLHGSFMSRKPFIWRRMPEIFWCRQMVREGKIHLLGTDMHRSDYRPPRLKAAVEWLQKELGDAAYRRLLRENPRKLLAGGVRGKTLKKFPPPE